MRELAPEIADQLATVSSGSAEIICAGKGIFKPVSLVPPRKLKQAQIDQFCRLLMDPDSHHHAKKRCVPRPTARVLLKNAATTIVLILDLGCLGWHIKCRERTSHSFFDPVAENILSLLKEIFSEYASPNKRSVWRAGVIHRLKQEALRAKSKS